MGKERKRGKETGRMKRRKGRERGKDTGRTN